MNTRFGPIRLAVSSVLISTAVVFAGGPAATAAPAPSCAAGHWVGSWTAAPSDTVSGIDPSLTPQISVSNQTYRLIITPHRGGSTLRIHLTNRFRPAPIEPAHVTIGAAADGAALRPGSLREVSFAGRPGVRIAPGGDVISDPVTLPFKAFQPLAVSVYVPGLAVAPTEHFDADATSYYSPPFAGDTAADPAGSALSLRTTALPLLSGLDVRAPGNVSAVVAFGDSITDGYVASNVLGTPQNTSVLDRNVRYPDFLQRRLDAAGEPVSVLDAGISGNRVTEDGLIPQFGPSAVARLSRDVIDQAGATDVIVLQGINDLGMPIGVGYDQLVAGYTNLIDRLHAAGLKVHLGTILPAADALSDGILTFPPANPVRKRLNAWIRTQHLADSVIDFAAAVRDPANPDILDPRYAGPDNLHPNAPGYRAMAAAIDLGSLRGPCR